MILGIKFLFIILFFLLITICSLLNWFSNPLKGSTIKSQRISQAPPTSPFHQSRILLPSDSLVFPESGFSSPLSLWNICHNSTSSKRNSIIRAYYITRGWSQNFACVILLLWKQQFWIITLHLPLDMHKTLPSSFQIGSNRAIGNANKSTLL